MFEVIQDTTASTANLNKKYKLIKILQTTPPPLNLIKTEKPNEDTDKSPPAIQLQGIKVAMHKSQSTSLLGTMHPEEKNIKAKFMQDLKNVVPVVDVILIDIINRFMNQTKTIYTTQIDQLKHEVNNLKDEHVKLKSRNQVLIDEIQQLNEKGLNKCTTHESNNTNSINKSVVMSEIKSLGAKFLNDIEMLIANERTRECKSHIKANNTLNSVLKDVTERLHKSSFEELAECEEELTQLYRFLMKNLPENLKESHGSLMMYNTDIHVSDAVIKDVSMGYKLQRPNMNIGKITKVQQNKLMFIEFYKYLQMCDRIIDENGDRLLHKAVLNNNQLEVQKYCIILKLQEKPLEALYNHDDCTPLHYAVMHQAISPEIIAIMLKYGARFDATDGNNNTLLHLAVEYKTLENLLSDAVLNIVDVATIHNNINKHNEDGDTPLHLAAKHGLCSYVELLLNFNADVNCKDLTFGRSPLYHAIENNHVEVVKILIANNADSHQRTYGGTSIIEALENTQLDVTPEMKKLFYKDRMAVAELQRSLSPVEETTPKKSRKALKSMSDTLVKRRKI